MQPFDKLVKGCAWLANFKLKKQGSKQGQTANLVEKTLSCFVDRKVARDLHALSCSDGADTLRMAEN